MPKPAFSSATTIIPNPDYWDAEAAHLYTSETIVFGSDDHQYVINPNKNGAVGNYEIDPVTGDGTSSADWVLAEKRKVLPGVHDVGTETIAYPFEVIQTGVMRVGENETLTVDRLPEAGRNQIFDVSAAGANVQIKESGDVFPEWFGGDDNAIQSALTSSKSGSRIVLAAKEYTSNGIDLLYDSDSVDGGDISKELIGSGICERYQRNGNGFHGTVLKLADGSNRELLSVGVNPDSTDVAFSHGYGAVRNMFLDGNRGGQATDADIVSVGGIRDFEIETLNVFNGSRDGISFNGANNQIQVKGKIEIYNCSRDGFRGSSVGDGNWVDGCVIAQNNGRYGINIGTGNVYAQLIYSYFNGLDGVRIDTAGTFKCDYVRSEDNERNGIRVGSFAKNVHIDKVMVADNGVLNSTTQQAIQNRAGINIASNSENIFFGCVSVVARTNSSIEHNQDLIIYDGGAKNVVIGPIQSEAFGMYDADFSAKGLADAGYQTIDAKASGRTTSQFIQPRGTQELDAIDSVDLHPAIFDRYVMSNIGASLSIPDIPATQRIEGITLSFYLNSLAGTNITWGASYSGVTVSVPSGETLIKIRCELNNWVEFS